MTVAARRQSEPTATALRELPLGAVRPTGWLAEQLQLQANGLTGALEEIWPDVGPNSAWLGGSGEDWERGPYYLDGLVPLAHLSGDPGLLAKASRWVDAILASQRPNGSFGPQTNEDWWPRMVALKALTQHTDATGDSRTEPFLARYFRYQLRELPARPLSDWGRARAADNVLSVLWLHGRTGQAWLLELATLLHGQTTDWEGLLRDFPATGATVSWDHLTHVVNVAMGIKTPGVAWLLDGQPDHREALERGLTSLDRFHGQVHGMFSGDEWLAGPDARRGVELCAVVEMMFSLEQLIRIWGDTAHADRLERLAYNLLPAAMTADVTAHQYHQQANQVLATIDQRDWTQAGDDSTIFGLEPNFGCCTANLHQGWPKLVRAMWMETPDGGLAAVVHGPSTVRWTTAGQAVEIEAVTEYPFGESITYTIRSEGVARFPLRLRVPGWCRSPLLQVNGRMREAAPDRGFVTLDREWAHGDRVEFRLPMEVRIIPRPRGAVGVYLGPLVLAFSPGEIWHRLPGSGAFGDWEVRPRRSWNMALIVGPDGLPRSVRIERFGSVSPPFGLRTGQPPFGVECVPLKVWLAGTRASDWLLLLNDAPPPPESPIERVDFEFSLPLVPYGCARLRIAEFPTARPSESP